MKAIKLFLLCRADYCKIPTEDINEAIAEVEAMQERIKELEAENEDLLQQVNDYEQFSETIASARG